MGLVRPDLEISPRTYTRRNIRLDVSIFYQEILSYLRLISHNRWKFADSKIRKFKDLASPVPTKIVKKSVRFRTVFCQFIRLYKNFFLHCDVQRKFRNSGSWHDRWMADSSIPWRSARKRSYPAEKLAALGYVVAREKGAWDRGRSRKLQSSLFRAGPRDEHEQHVPFHISLFVPFFASLRTYVRGPTKIRLVVGHRRKSTDNGTCRDLSRMLARSVEIR